MADEVFTDPDGTNDEWVDVRMTDPDQGEWDVDVIIADGRVEYVDLRIRPALLAAFVECLIEDVGAERAAAIVRDVADRNDLDVTVGSDEPAP